MQFHKAALALVVSLLAIGCVQTPEDLYSYELGSNPNNYRFFDAEPELFEGWGTAPNSAIHIEVLNKKTGAWLQVGTVNTASASVSFGGESLYHWKTELDLKDRIGISQLRCYLRASCAGEFMSHVGSVIDHVVFRFREPAGKVNTLFSHRIGGFQCTMERVTGGEDLSTAYTNCNPPSAMDRVRVTYW